MRERLKYIKAEASNIPDERTPQVHQDRSFKYPRSDNASTTLRQKLQISQMRERLKYTKAEVSNIPDERTPQVHSDRSFKYPR